MTIEATVFAQIVWRRLQDCPWACMVATDGNNRTEKNVILENKAAMSSDRVV